MGKLSEAENRARVIVNQWAGSSALVGWIPGSSLVIAGFDTKMVHDVAEVFEVRGVNAAAVLTIIAGTVAGRGVSELLSFIPIAGWAIKAATAAGVTKAVGEGVIQHLRSQSPLTDW